VSGATRSNGYEHIMQWTWLMVMHSVIGTGCVCVCDVTDVECVLLHAGGRARTALGYPSRLPRRQAPAIGTVIGPRLARCPASFPTSGTSVLHG
jgi:hypothetical protein